jgi:hypothetical protein
MNNEFKQFREVVENRDGSVVVHSGIIIQFNSIQFNSIQIIIIIIIIIIITMTSLLYSAIELYRPIDRRLSVKLVPTFADRGVSRSQRNGSPKAIISHF